MGRGRGDDGSGGGGGGSDETLLTAAEFYCGVGGLHYALLDALPPESGVQGGSGSCSAPARPRVRVRAFDLNPHACETYAHNFGERPKEGNVQALSAQQLDALGASLWLMSPPCQPYTRQGLKRDTADGRAASFLDLLERLREMKAPPTHILVENVCGFETSETHAALLSALRDTGYAAQGAMLSPLEVGVPYSRPRYFVLAKRVAKGHAFAAHPCAHAYAQKQVQAEAEPEAAGHAEEGQHAFGVWQSGPPPQPPWHTLGGVRAGDAAGAGIDADGTRVQPLSDYLENGDAPIASDFTYVSEATLRKHGVVIDLVDADDTKTCCFTKNYYKYAKGTGSVLVTRGSRHDVRWGDHAWSRVEGPVDASVYPTVGSRSEMAEQTVADLIALRARYFTPREVASLHSFPPSFGFPDRVTLKQRYALLGNSLSVAVLTPLIRYLLWDDHEGPSEGNSHTKHKRHRSDGPERSNGL